MQVCRCSGDRLSKIFGNGRITEDPLPGIGEENGIGFKIPFENDVFGLGKDNVQLVQMLLQVVLGSFGIGNIGENTAKTHIALGIGHTTALYQRPDLAAVLVEKPAGKLRVGT